LLWTVIDGVDQKPEATSSWFHVEEPAVCQS
jgi:hypothetical protein